LNSNAETTVIRIYGIRSCDSCRAARTWLKEQGVTYEYLDIRDDGLNPEQLQRWQEMAGWQKLLNRKSITWRKIPAIDRENLDARAAGRLILAYPTVMRRPVLDTGKEVLLGFDAEVYAAALSGKKRH
jgi:arsenate reductase